jgi:hypothetical protein
VANESVVRIRVADHWNLKEFGTLLGLVEKSYFRVAILASPPLQNQLFESWRGVEDGDFHHVGVVVKAGERLFFEEFPVFDVALVLAPEGHLVHFFPI